MVGKAALSPSNPIRATMVHVQLAVLYHLSAIGPHALIRAAVEPRAAPALSYQLPRMVALCALSYKTHKAATIQCVPLTAWSPRGRAGRHVLRRVEGACTAASAPSKRTYSMVALHAQ